MNWIATFIIAFREAIEISLTLVLILAATRGLAGRGRWICFGMVLGLIGSALVAVFTQAISNSLEGMGQEILNAAVLGLSAFLIGCTVVWMKHHGGRLAAQVKKTSSAVLCGKKPTYVLSAVIGLTVLRDGAEMVLLSHGLFLIGNTLQLICGAVLGLFAGGLLGWGIYLGIVRLRIQRIFSALSIMLGFVAAGMAAQSVGFLAAADVLPQLSLPLWDSSSLMSESTLLGGLLHNLFGYTSRPSGMQLIFYFSTLLLILFALRVAHKDMRTASVHSH